MYSVCKISQTDTTKLGLREGHDVIDSAFTSLLVTYLRYNYLYIRPGEYAGTSNDPYLTVTYTQPTTTTTTTTTNEVTHAYDHAMRRVSKISDSGTTYYPTSDYSVEGSTTTVYVSGSSGLVASIGNDGTTFTTSTIHTDHLGSTSVVTDESGIMIELLDYNPYGTKRSSWSASSDDGQAQAAKTYIGEYSDDESGFSYLNARYYDPERGQFLGQDPVFVSMGAFTDERQLAMLLDPQLQNSYSYARGNPISMSDASGESPVETIAGFFVGTGKGAWGMVTDLVGMVAHPVAALQSMISSIKAIASDPVATADFLAQYLGDSVREYISNSTDYERGMMLGALAIDMIGTGKKGFLDDVGRAAVQSLRRSAVKEAWGLELARALKGEQTLMDWTLEQLEELKTTGRVSGYEGHHINSVNGHPEMAGDPANITFRTRENHLEEHGGDWSNQTEGELSW